MELVLNRLDSLKEEHQDSREIQSILGVTKKNLRGNTAYQNVIFPTAWKTRELRLSEVLTDQLKRKEAQLLRHMLNAELLSATNSEKSEFYKGLVFGALSTLQALGEERMIRMYEREQTLHMELGVNNDNDHMIMLTIQPSYWREKYEISSFDEHFPLTKEEGRDIIHMYKGAYTEEQSEKENSAYYDGMQQGISDALLMMGRKDIWDQIDFALMD